MTTANRATLIVVGVLSLLGLAYAIARVDILRARIVDVHMDLQRSKEQLQNSTEQLSALKQHEQQQTEQLALAQNTLNRLSAGLDRQIASATQQWARAEVLYLSRLATAQLHQAHDLNGARASLQAALERSLAQPGTIPESVTSELRSALAHLATLTKPSVDVIGTLLSIEASASQLPVAATLAPAAPTTSGLWSSLSSALGKLLVIRRSADAAAEYSTAADIELQRLLLQQYVRSARLAASLHDQASYTQALSGASHALRNAFEPADASVIAVRNQLQQLSSVNVAPVLPDLSQSMATLNALLAPGTTP